MTNYIYISSNINFDENELIKLFNEKFSNEYNIIKIKTEDIYLPPQTLNTGAILVANDKFNNIIKQFENEIVLVIHNSIKIVNNKLIDYISLSLYFNNNKYTISGEELEINFTILEKYPKFKNIIDDLLKSYINSNKKYIYDGCQFKLSEIIDKYYNTSNDWTNYIFKISNSTRVSNILLKLFLIIPLDIL
jgi:hypothetical protein